MPTINYASKTLSVVRTMFIHIKQNDGTQDTVNSLEDYIVAIERNTPHLFASHMQGPLSAILSLLAVCMAG